MFKQGRPLSVQEQSIFRAYFAQNVLNVARIIDGRVPFWLRRDMCAVVLGHRIYLRTGGYQPNTKRGVELLGLIIDLSKQRRMWVIRRNDIPYYIFHWPCHEAHLA